MQVLSNPNPNPARALARRGGALRSGVRNFDWPRGAGFLSGSIRVNLVVPPLGERRAELLEMSVMFAVVWFASHHVERQAQLRRNFEFCGAATAIFVFVHGGLREFSVLDAGLLLQTLMLSAHAHGLGTCAQGALATWAGPVRGAFEIPAGYKLVCGVSIGYASDSAVNAYNPGRGSVAELLVRPPPPR